MKTRIKIFVTMVLFMATLSLMAQGIKFEHSSWAEVKRKAQAQNKLIFVDFYASWCGPCKYMSRDVFTNNEVGNFFNENFISYKVDAEEEEQDLVESISLEAYPTLVFFDAKGKILFKHVGAADEQELRALGQSVTAYNKNEALIKNGEASRQQTIEYLGIAKNANPGQYAAIMKDFMLNITVDDLLFLDAWNVVTPALNDVYHPLFQQIIDDAKTLSAVHGETYIEYVNDVLSAHFEAMVDANNLKGLDIYKRNFQVLFRELIDHDYAYGFFDLDTNAKFYLHREDMKAYGQAVVSLVEGYAMDDAEKLARYALELSSHIQENPFKEKAVAWAIRATELDRNKGSVYTLARVYEQVGQKPNAIACAKTLFDFELSEDEKTFINDYLQELQS